MDASSFLLSHELRRFESACATALVAIARARTMREVSLAVRGVHAPAWARPVARTLPAHRRLHAEAERRMETLLDEHLAELRACGDAEAQRRMRGQRLQLDWCFLRGGHARLFVRAMQESASPGNA